MILEILKYLSPAIILTLLYNLFQLFQKRKYEKNDLKRKETIDTYKEFHSIINSIKNEYWKLFSSINQTTILLQKKINEINDSKTEHIDFIKEIQRETSKFNTKSKKEIKETTNIINSIEKDGYDKIKHQEILQEHLDQALKRDEIGKNLSEKNSKLIDKLKNQNSILKKPLGLEDDFLLKKTKEISTKLQSLILNLNNIPLIATNIKNKPHVMIQNLTLSTQNIINSIETENNINELNILDIIDIDNIEKSMNELSLIEEHIYQVLK